MNIKILLKTSLRCLKNHKIRSLLTILGIIIGISAIISTLAIGYGAEAKLKHQILGMGNNFIFVQSGKAIDEGKTRFAQRKKSYPLLEQDCEIIKKQCSEIKKITPNLFARDVISFQNNHVLVDIKSGNQDYLESINRKIKHGNNFTNYHVKKCSKVVILGSKAAEELFNFSDPIGKPIKIRNIIFTVIGVTKKLENYIGIMDPNLDIYMPYTTAKKQIFYQTNQKIHGISVSTYNKEELATVAKNIKLILRTKHRLQQEDSDDFTIFDQQAMINAAKKSSNILTLLLLIIASISLLVGGIGIMNIMLVSVYERTQEIGIRMALGATKSLILKQFIIEALTLCFIGGTIGILLGIIIPHIVSIFTSWPVVIKISNIIFAFTITFIIGLIFGFYPAQKASELNPVEALQDR